MMNQEKPVQRQFLSGWKEIANYLGKGVRTVQRYEREMGLPILRLTGKSAVTAIRPELDNWVTNSHASLPSPAKRRALESRTNELRAKFLQIDSEIALTFSNLAMTASNPEKKRRTVQTAREAYDTIMRLRKDTQLRDAEKHKLEANLQRLKHELERLGQRL